MNSLCLNPNQKISSTVNCIDKEMRRVRPSKTFSPKRKEVKVYNHKLRESESESELIDWVYFSSLAFFNGNSLSVKKVACIQLAFQRSLKNAGKIHI